MMGGSYAHKRVLAVAVLGHRARATSGDKAICGNPGMAVAAVILAVHSRKAVMEEATISGAAIKEAATSGGRLQEGAISGAVIGGMPGIAAIRVVVGGILPGGKKAMKPNAGIILNEKLNKIIYNL